MNTNFSKSAELNEKAKKVLVGGVNSPVRSFKRVGRHPIFAVKGQGARLMDADGNSYLDFVMSYGPHLFGHARKEIIEAVNCAMAGSSCFGMTHEAEIEWAELFLKRVPGAEKVRALSSGTEACLTAVRLARGHTQRPIMVKFAGNYHGHVDSLLMSAGSGVATLAHQQSSVPECAGIPVELAQSTRVLKYNDVPGLRKLFKETGPKIAGVILEPIVGNMGVIPPKLEFLKALREECTKSGALLIFDEVMTGLRVHKESAQGLFGVRPDLSTFGKIVGGGLPLAALCGPAKIMDSLAPLGPVYQAGTLSGNPVAIAAGIAMMKLIDKMDPYEKLEKLSSHMERVFLESAEKAKVPVVVNRVGSMISPFFVSRPVENDEDALAGNMEQFVRFFWSSVKHGWMFAPSPFEAAFLSYTHDEVLEDSFRATSEKIFAEIQG
jgi:glutamate-1-semialdehyde 2,1-aminomutase